MQGCQRKPRGEVLFWSAFCLRGAHGLSLTIIQSVTVWQGLVSVKCRLPSSCPYAYPPNCSLVLSPTLCFAFSCFTTCRMEELARRCFKGLSPFSLLTTMVVQIQHCDLGNSFAIIPLYFKLQEEGRVLINAAAHLAHTLSFHLKYKTVLGDKNSPRLQQNERKWGAELKMCWVSSVQIVRELLCKQIFWYACLREFKE